MRRATKKPAVPCTCGSVCRNSGRRGVAELWPLFRERRIDLEPGGVDDRFGLVRVDRADGVDDRPAGTHALRSCSKELELQVGERFGSPAKIGPAVEDAEPRARRVDQRSVEPGQSRRKLPSVGDDDADARCPEAAHRLLELARARLVDLDRDHLAGEHRRLAAGRGAEIERALPLARPDDEADELRRGALRPDPALGESGLVDSLDVPGARDVRIGRPSISPRTSRTTVDPGSFSARIRFERLVGAEVAPPCVRDPVRIRVLERRLARASSRAAPRRVRSMPSASRRSTAFVNATARSSPARRTSSTDSLTAAYRGTPSTKPSWYAPRRSAALTGGSRR